MSNHMPIVFTMFGIVILSLIIVSVATYYGSDWTWIAQTNAGLVLLLMVMSIAFITLIGWLKHRG